MACFRNLDTRRQRGAPHFQPRRVRLACSAGRPRHRANRGLHPLDAVGQLALVSAPLALSATSLIALAIGVPVTYPRGPTIALLQCIWSQALFRPEPETPPYHGVLGRVPSSRRERQSPLSNRSSSATARASYVERLLHSANRALSWNSGVLLELALSLFSTRESPTYVGFFALWGSERIRGRRRLVSF
jgi:hypothetical protein